MNEELVVNIKSLTKIFGKFKAVDSIDLKIKKGEIYGFLGPNGAGKTTKIKMLCGILPLYEGVGNILEYDILKEYEKIKKNLGYMSQKFSLYNGLTVYENIRFFSGIYGVSKREKRERIEGVLKMAGLEEMKDFPTKNLPLGLKQKLALGCAIIHKPPLLFLDEPTAGVDPLSRQKFWEIIYNLSMEGTTVFLTTHYLDEADYCTKIGLLYKGKIIAEGRPEELKEAKNSSSMEEVFISLIKENICYEI